MRKKQTIVIILLCTAIVAVLGVSVSLAWFYTNMSISTDNMGMYAEVSPNMVITDNAAKISTMTVSTLGADRVELTDNRDNKLIPCTHYAGADASYQLAYCRNTFDVNRETGLVSPITLIPVVEAKKDTFFAEYTVYIASVGNEMKNVNLQVAVSLAEGELSDSLRAASVDFYVDDVYEGTLNLAGLDASVNDATTEKTSLLLTLANDTLPLNKRGKITLTMRCYFDGALKKDADHTFVTTNSLDTSNVMLDMQITAVDIPKP